MRVHRLMTHAALVALLALGLLGAVPRTAGARAQSGETSYTNEEYGWSLEWDGDVWATFTPNSAASDLALRNVGATGRSALYFVSTDAWGTPADCVDGRQEEIEAEAGVEDVARVEEAPSGDDAEAAGAVFSLTYTNPNQADAQPVERINDVTCLSLVPDEAVLSVTHITGADAYADEAEAVDDLVAGITFAEGEVAATEPADDEATETPEDDEATEPAGDKATGTPEGDGTSADEEPSADEATETAEAEEDAPETPDSSGDVPDPEEGVEGNTYTSPTYGFTLEWDEDIWELDLENPRVPGRDTLVLTSVSFSGYVYVEAYEDFDGDPADCLEGSSAEITDDDIVDDVAPFEDENGDPVEGEEDGVVFAAYTLTSGNDEAAAYFDCQTLVEGEAVLAFSLLAAVDDAEVAFDALADLRAALDLSTVGETGGDASETPEGDDATATPEDEETETPEAGDLAGVDGAAYESPTFGYTLEWDDEIWTVESATSEDDSDTLVLASENSVVTIAAYAGFDGDAAACVEAVEDEITDRDGVSDVTILEDDDGDPIAEGDEEYSYVYYGYTLDDGNDSENLYEYVECSSFGDDETVLQISQVAPLQGSEQELDDLDDLLETFEFGDQGPVLWAGDVQAG
ncbi:MAG: hypothetical protein H0U40_11005 [Chloroflexia bacterium]|nr:hypothetical protein [Chloroflexia bacterium]